MCLRTQIPQHPRRCSSEARLRLEIKYYRRFTINARILLANAGAVVREWFPGSRVLHRFGDGLTFNTSLSVTSTLVRRHDNEDSQCKCWNNTHTHTHTWQNDRGEAVSPKSLLSGKISVTNGRKRQHPLTVMCTAINHIDLSCRISRLWGNVGHEEATNVSQSRACLRKLIAP